MPSFSALRLAGRLRPTLSTGPNGLDPEQGGGVRGRGGGGVSHGLYYVLSRIVIFYNEFGRSQ